MSAPVNAEIGATLGRFFHGGAGPSHTSLSSTFAQAGYKEDDPYDGSLPNKEQRVQVVVSAAVRRPNRARELVEAILTQLRVAGAFDSQRLGYDADAVRSAQRAFHRIGWQLDSDGYLSPLGIADVATGGRAALDEQLDRLRRASDDPALLIGTAKDLLEAVAKFVLEELGASCSAKADFANLWYLARERLGIHPSQVDSSLPGATVIQTVMQSAWNIADSVNQLRNLQGTGHGRTLPTGVTTEMALLIVREACGIAEYVLLTLDRQLGRATT